MTPNWIETVAWSSDGLVPAVVQDAASGEVLMVAWMDRESLERLEATLAARLGADPASSYVASLHAQGQDQILKKVAEEAVETVIASKSGDRGSIVHETADLIFHCMVMLSWHGIALGE